MVRREGASQDHARDAPDEEDASWVVPFIAASMAKLFAGIQVLNLAILTLICAYGAGFGAGNNDGDRVTIGVTGVVLGAVTWYLGRVVRAVYRGSESGVTRLLVIEVLLVSAGVVAMVVEGDVTIPMLYLVAPAVIVGAPLAFRSVRTAAAKP